MEPPKTGLAGFDDRTRGSERDSSAMLGQDDPVVTLDQPLVELSYRRGSYGGDESRWWSYVPPEYFELEGRGYAEQIAGQVHYLGRFYDRALAEVGGTSVRVRYEDLCARPASALEAVVGEIERTYGHRIEFRQAPPPSFGFREYSDRDTDKEMFAGLLDDLRRADA
jgi:hypothetical protein